MLTAMAATLIFYLEAPGVLARRLNGLYFAVRLFFFTAPRLALPADVPGTVVALSSWVGTEEAIQDRAAGMR